MWYIKESNNIEEILDNKQFGFPTIIRKIIYLYKYIFNNPTIRQIENGYIYIIPVNLKKEKMNDNKICAKMIKVLKKYNVKNVALSKYLNTRQDFKNYIYSQNIHILNGRKLFNILAIDCLKYITEKQNVNLENTEVTVLVNDVTDINIGNIKLISENAKIVSVVSKNINKLRSLTNQIYEENGSLIKLSNNIKKSLSRAKLILNIDFPEELLNKYNIYNKSIIININENIKIQRKAFLGITIQYFDCNLPLKYIHILKDNKLCDSFDRTVICESLICIKDTFNNLRKRVEKENIRICGLIGNKMRISDDEFEKSIDKS